MNENNDIDYYSMSDDRLLLFIGEFIRHHRLEQNITQSSLAKNAGLSRSTISLIENGQSTSLICIIKVLRILDLLYVLDSFKILNSISPMELIKLQKNKRKRSTGNLL